MRNRETKANEEYYTDVLGGFNSSDQELSNFPYNESLRSYLAVRQRCIVAFQPDDNPSQACIKTAFEAIQLPIYCESAHTASLLMVSKSSIYLSPALAPD